MTLEENKIFHNWEEQQGVATNVIVTDNQEDAQAIWDIIPTPMICLPWTDAGAEWLRKYVKEGWFKKVETFFLAGGNGSAKTAGADALTSVLGSAKCVVCDWGEYGNAAEAAKQGGAEAVTRVFALNLQPYDPIGVVRVNTLMPEIEALWMQKEQDTGLALHWGEDFDQHCRFAMRTVAIVVGRDGEGKSSWIDELTTRLALIHNLKISIWTPEAGFMKKHTVKLLRLLYQRENINNLSHDMLMQGSKWIAEHFVYVDFPYPDGYADMTPEEQRHYMPTLSNITRKMCHNAESFGARVFVLDPLLLIKKDNPRQENIDFYQEIIDSAKFLAHNYQGLVILVSHPPRLTATDLQRSDRPVTTHDIYGTSRFAYLLDYTFAVNRFDKKDGRSVPYVMVEIGKVKEQQYGTRTTTFFTFQPRGERFNPTTMRDVETKNGKGTTHIEPAQTYVNPKRWLDKEGKPDLAALEFQLPVNMVNGEKLKVNDSTVNHAPGSARRTPLRGENPEPVNHEPSKVNRQLSMDSLLDDAAQNQNPSLPD